MFQGYSQETVDFMWGIRFNNERGWFPAAPRPGTLQGPPVVLRPHRGPGLDRPPYLLF